LGRWKRNYSGALNVRWFGAKGSGQRIANLMVVKGSDSFRAALASGSGADINYSAGVNTVTGCSCLESDMVGKTLFIGGSQYPGNNGTSFTVATVDASTQSFTYTNASGVTDTTKDVNWSIGYSTNTFSPSDVGKSCTLVAPGSETAQTGYISDYDSSNDSSQGAVTVTFNTGDTYVGNGMFVWWGFDDTAAINAAIEMASSGTVAATVYFPAGVYMTTGLTLAEWNSGITLRGEGTLAPSQGTCPPSTIGVGSVIRLVAPAPFLLKVQSTCFRVENLWWDGTRLASDVVQFNYLTTQGHFENCLFTGAAVDTGYIHHYALIPGIAPGDQEIDNLSFHRCTLTEDRGDWGVIANACVYNENPEAFQIEYEDCYFAGADTIAHFNQGSCDFYNGQMFNWTTAAIRVETYCEPFHVENIYNEGDKTPFFQQVLNAGANSVRSITIKDCQLNADTPIVFIGTQPLTLINVSIGAPITVNPDPVWGIHRLTSVNTTFPAGNDFTGTGYPDAVDEIGTTFLISSGLSRSRIVSPVETYADSALANYNQDGLSLVVAGAAISAAAGTVIAGDSHWITELTSDRTYALSQSGVNLGSRMRISRVAAGDSNAVTIHNQSGTPLVTLGSATGLGWADFLYVANNGWVLFAKGPA
jgi:hypothetical protein